MSGLVIPERIITRIEAQAREEAPNEACGYLRGIEGQVRGMIRMTNVDASPEHFSLDPSEQFAAVREARENGEGLLAVYHSHPETPARMSAEDIRLANDTSIVYVIHSLATGDTRAFTVDREKNVSDVPLSITTEA